MIKFDHKAKNFAAAMGMSDKRWDEITSAVRVALISPEAKTTPQEIEMALKKLGKASDTDLVVLGYVVGAHFASNNFPSNNEAMKLALIAMLMK